MEGSGKPIRIDRNGTIDDIKPAPINDLIAAQDKDLVEIKKSFVQELKEKKTGKSNTPTQTH
jgi:hypothetical protein